MHSILQTLIVAALSLYTVTGAHIGSRRPPRTDSAKSSIRSSGTGIAFDLTASYGSAAVSFPNGTTLTVAEIPASQDYNDALQRLSLASSQHLSPPYDNLGESWDDMPRQYLRKARKVVGLPASRDVGLLAEMISALRDAVQEKIGGDLQSIDVAAVTTMHLLALYDEDLHDAFEYLGLEYITFPVGDVGHNILYQTSAAFAGYGYGLCDDYVTDPKACQVEQWNMPDQTVMAVVYTDTTLAVSLSVLRSAFALWEPRYRYLADFDLGYQEIDKLSSTEEVEQYWASVKARLGEILVENPYYQRPSIVMLMGDRTEDASFREVLDSALSEYLHEPPTVLSDGSKGVAARGAAEMAKRELFFQSQPVRHSCSKTGHEDEKLAAMEIDGLRVQ